MTFARVARFALLLLAAGCASTSSDVLRVRAPRAGGKQVAPLPPPIELYLGGRADRWSGLVSDGGSLEFELYRFGSNVAQVVRNGYVAPVVIRWKLIVHENLESDQPFEGITVLPAAPNPHGAGENVLLSRLRPVAVTAPTQIQLEFSAEFGDPSIDPQTYAYRLPFPAGQTFRIDQGFHGKATHAGRNEYALDFACPEGTPILAMRGGVVLMTNASARDGGMDEGHADWRRANFVSILHDDGTIASYVHLAPGGVHVKAWQAVERGDRLGSSGNTGLSTGPHLHVHVSTSGVDGNLRTFPFRLAVAPDRDEAPVQGRSYSAWETN